MSQDDIKGSKVFEVRLGDSKVPYDIEVTIVSADGENDGWLPYGSTINSLDSLTVKTSTGTDITSDIVEGTPTITDDRIELDLNYPSTNGAGDYIIWATINFTVASVARKKTLRAARIKVY